MKNERYIQKTKKHIGGYYFLLVFSTSLILLSNLICQNQNLNKKSLFILFVFLTISILLRAIVWKDVFVFLDEYFSIKKLDQDVLLYEGQKISTTEGMEKQRFRLLSNMRLKIRESLLWLLIGAYAYLHAWALNEFGVKLNTFHIFYALISALLIVAPPLLIMPVIFSLLATVIILFNLGQNDGTLAIYYLIFTMILTITLGLAQHLSSSWIGEQINKTTKKSPWPFGQWIYQGLILFFVVFTFTLLLDHKSIDHYINKAKTLAKDKAYKALINSNSNKRMKSKRPLKMGLPVGRPTTGGYNPQDFRHKGYGTGSLPQPGTSSAHELDGKSLANNNLPDGLPPKKSIGTEKISSSKRNPDIDKFLNDRPKDKTRQAPSKLQDIGANEEDQLRETKGINPDQLKGFENWVKNSNQDQKAAQEFSREITSIREASLSRYKRDQAFNTELKNFLETGTTAPPPPKIDAAEKQRLLKALKKLNQGQPKQVSRGKDPFKTINSARGTGPLSQRELDLAEELGLNQDKIEDIEAGQSLPPSEAHGIIKEHLKTEKRNSEIKRQKLKKSLNSLKKADRFAETFFKFLKVIVKLAIGILVIYGLCLLFFKDSQAKRKSKKRNKMSKLDLMRILKTVEQIQKSHLSADQEVVKTYNAVIELMSKSPVPKESSTPSWDYMDQFQKYFPKGRDEFYHFTNQYCHTFYGKHSASPEELQSFRSHYKVLVSEVSKRINS